LQIVVKDSICINISNGVSPFQKLEPKKLLSMPVSMFPKPPIAKSIAMLLPRNKFAFCVDGIWALELKLRQIKKKSKCIFIFKKILIWSKMNFNVR